MQNTTLRFATTLTPGDPVPWFQQRSTSAPKYTFDTAAGRYIVLCFFGSAGAGAGPAAIAAVNANRQLFDDRRASFFGVSLDPEDEKLGRVKESLPGIRFFWDFDRVVSRAYGAIPLDVSTGSLPVRQFWLVLDPTLRVLRIIPFAPDGSDREALFAYLRALPPPAQFAGMALQAPVLVLHNVFERELCETLVGLYEKHGGAESGVMREVDGKTIAVVDPAYKQRRDYLIEDDTLIKTTQARVKRRIVPEIAKIHHFTATRMERYIVGCYAASEGGHFQPHRDNTTKGTAHRRFAVSINLNSDFEGGEVIFPEYGPRGFKPPPGGAVVFSCSLLHALSPVTKGSRYAFLPFLYDDAAAELRTHNNQFLDDSVEKYSGA